MANASNGTNNITYTYDANGLRHTKTVDGVEYKYYYAGDKLVRETFGSTVIDFFYDPDGRPYAMKYNGLVLYYVLNQQGDVVRLIDSEGVNYGTYKYDAWGNILQMPSTNYIKNNPLRYRGYVYDPETELYYCQSRYYDPKIGRFLNADALVSTGQGLLGNNMFAYCNNNAVSYIDSSGRSARPTTVAINDGGYANYIDITEKLNSFMKSNAEKLTKYMDAYGYIAAAFYFYNNVNDYGALDIKLQADWKFEKGNVYMYDGIILREDDPGNINFGYIGAVLFPEEILCIGAGVNQISKYGFKYGNITTYYDDPRDQIMIRLGYRLYIGDLI